MTIAILLFATLSLGVILLRPRWSLVCFLLLSNVSLSGWQSGDSSSVAVDTVVKAVILPCCLFIKLRVDWESWTKWSIPSKLWVALTAYALISAAWSPNKLAAVKMFVYLLSYACLFPVFAKAWQAGWLNPSALVGASWGVVFIAAVQTYIVGNPFSVDEGRLTSFTSPQYFAAYFVCVLALLLWSDLSRRILWSTALAILICIVLSGSRYVFLGTLALVGMFWLTRRRDSAREGGRLARAGVTILIIVLLGYWAVPKYLPDSRLNELVESYNEESVTPVGTFVWRLAIYDEGIQQIADRWPSDLPRLIFGAGTSSGIAVLSQLSSEYLEAEDANRCIHDEFLRAQYEWGVVGLGLFLGFLGTTFWPYLKSIRCKKSVTAFVLIGILPTLLLGLTFENILAGPVAAGGTGYALILSYGAVFLTAESTSSLSSLN